MLLNGHNHGMLKSKALWQLQNTVVPDKHNNFMVNSKKEDVGVVTTCISREIRIHTSGIHCPNEEWKTLKKLLISSMKFKLWTLEKELISLEPPFDMIEDYAKQMWKRLPKEGRAANSTD